MKFDKLTEAYLKVVNEDITNPSSRTDVYGEDTALKRIEELYNELYRISDLSSLNKNTPVPALKQEILNKLKELYSTYKEEIYGGGETQKAWNNRSKDAWKGTKSYKS
jgi:hypothetical protein